MSETIEQLKQIVQRIAQGGSLQPMLADVLTLALPGTGAQGIRILMGNNLENVVESGSLAAAMSVHDSLVSTTVLNQSSGHAVEIADLNQLPDGAAALEPLCRDLGSVAIYPISVAHTLSAIVWLGYTQPNGLSADKKQFAEFLAAQLAAVFTSARAKQNQSDFVGTLAHDLRSPLTFMQGFASMLPAVGELNDRQKQYVDKIMSGITQMSDLVEKVLDVRKIDPDGNYQLIRTACDVSRMLNEIAAIHTEAAERKEQHLEVDVDPNLPILNLDEVMLRRAVNNLVDNAVKYTPAHGTITVSGHIHHNHLVIAIKDTGLGINEENQRLLFSQFKRIRRKEHHLIKGSGLGLFIVKGIAMRHNGDAWLTSKEHEGSTFYISIPLEGLNLLGAAEVQTQGS